MPFEINDANINLHVRGLSGILKQYNPDRTQYYIDLQIKRMTTVEAYEQFIQSGDFPLATVLSEGQVVPDQSREWPFPFKVRPFKVGQGWSLSYEAWADDYYNEMDGTVEALKLAQNKTIERICADRWNNAQSTDPAYANPDGLPLAAVNHRLYGQGVGQGTASNLLNLPFNPNSVETIRSAMMLQPSHRGDPDPVDGPFDLIHHPSQIGAVQRCIKSNGWSGDPGDVINSIKGFIGKPVCNPYFQNPLQWGLRYSKADWQPFGILDRSSDLVEIWKQQSRQKIRHSVTRRFIAFERGWRGLIVSTGGGS